MKTTVVPAQITTVEDKIAGSLNFQQIMLLVMSLIIGTAIYALTPPRLHISVIKAVLVLLQFAFLGSLAIRVSGKILAEWLTIYLRYLLRPRVYTFQKSDLTSRDVILPTFERAKRVKTKTAKVSKTATKTNDQHLPETDYLNNPIFNPNLSSSVKPGKKGGLDVVLREL